MPATSASCATLTKAWHSSTAKCTVAPSCVGCRSIFIGPSTCEPVAPDPSGRPRASSGLQTRFFDDRMDTVDRAQENGDAVRRIPGRVEDTDEILQRPGGDAHAVSDP